MCDCHSQTKKILHNIYSTELKCNANKENKSLNIWRIICKITLERDFLEKYTLILCCP